MIKAGVIVFATDSSKAGVEDARAWLKEKALRPDQVRLYRDDGMVLIETLVPVDIR